MFHGYFGHFLGLEVFWLFLEISKVFLVILEVLNVFLVILEVLRVFFLKKSFSSILVIIILVLLGVFWLF